MPRVRNLLDRLRRGRNARGSWRRGRLVTAMAEVERLLVASMVQIAIADPRHPDSRHCIGAYVAELAQRFDHGFDPERSISAADEELTLPAGLLLVARLHADPVGCGALRLHPDGSAEVKRMWVSPRGTGLGLGRQLAELESEAATGRVRTLRLETNRAPDRGDRALPRGRVPGGGGVQRRAVRPPLVREDSRGLTVYHEVSTPGSVRGRQDQEAVMAEGETVARATSGRGTFGGLYLLTVIGAAVYFINVADGFWSGVLGLLKALIWPAFAVYRALELLNL